MLRVARYRELAEATRNLAQSAATPEIKEELLTLARTYDRKAAIREQALKASRAAPFE
jgi:hypothetical protein